jgi:hypothetical protein
MLVQALVAQLDAADLFKAGYLEAAAIHYDRALELGLRDACARAHRVPRNTDEPTIKNYLGALWSVRHVNAETSAEISLRGVRYDENTQGHACARAGRPGSPRSVL